MRERVSIFNHAGLSERVESGKALGAPGAVKVDAPSRSENPVHAIAEDACERALCAVVQAQVEIEALLEQVHSWGRE